MEAYRFSNKSMISIFVVVIILIRPRKPRIWEKQTSCLGKLLNAMRSGCNLLSNWQMDKSVFGNKSKLNLGSAVVFLNGPRKPRIWEKQTSCSGKLLNIMRNGFTLPSNWQMDKTVFGNKSMPNLGLTVVT